MFQAIDPLPPPQGLCARRFGQAVGGLRRPLMIALLTVMPWVGNGLHAEETGWYAGGGGSITDYQGPAVIKDLSGHGLDGTARLDTQAFPWQLFFGYRGTHHLGLEFEYLHLDKLEGTLDLTAPVVNSVDGLRETDGFSVRGHGAYPISRMFSLLATAGFYVWHVHSAASSLASATAVAAVEDHRGVAPRGGLGIEAIVTARSTLRFHWSAIFFSNEITNVYSFDFVHYFGKGS